MQKAAGGGLSGIPFMVMLHRNDRVAFAVERYGKGEVNTLLKQVNVLLSEPMTPI